MVDYSRFDIVQAHYWYCTHYYAGMMSREYARLCKMQRYYKPSPFENMPTSYAAAYIYNQLESNAGYTVTEWAVDDNGEIAWNNAG
jgi:hypothetical protein